MQAYLIKNEVGLDEAGRGPLIGRVYAGAVIWSYEGTVSNLITDSKKLTPKKRGIALEWIKQNLPYWSFGYADVDEIDSLNILQATKKAMERAIENLKTKYNKPITHLLVDGINWHFDNYQTTSVVKGDATYYSIAAASIIAKEYHDAHIKQLCADNQELNERYGLLSNMGYGTKKHIEGIKQYGYTEWHRKSFKLKNID